MAREGAGRKELLPSKRDAAADCQSQAGPQTTGHTFHLTNVFLCARYQDVPMSKINSISALWQLKNVCWDKDEGIREREGIEICKKSGIGQIMVIYSYIREMNELQLKGQCKCISGIMLSEKQTHRRIHAVWFNSLEVKKHAKLNDILFMNNNRWGKIIKKSREKSNPKVNLLVTRRARVRVDGWRGAHRAKVMIIFFL